MSTGTPLAANDCSAAELGTALRRRIDELSYLPTTLAVALKFIELGKNPNAEPNDYARVVGADAALSAKLLALSNSSWFGVRNRVTTVKGAVNLLGMATVRTLAISYCMTGLHNDLRLEPEESRRFWESSLCKAVAARLYAGLRDKTLCDEAFVVGMLQDLALPIMYATARQPMLAMFESSAGNWSARLEQERALFGLDHAEVGRMVLQKMDLPELLIDAVAFHHNRPSLHEFVERHPLADAIYVAGLFPHQLSGWHRQDADELCGILREHGGSTFVDTSQYLDAVQVEFGKLYDFFEEGHVPQARIVDLLIEAARDTADNTTYLVATVYQLMQQAAQAGVAVHQLTNQQSKLEQESRQDPLTGLLNRRGFTDSAAELLAKACRYETPLAVIFLDVDNFKAVNDTHGHPVGDQALRKTATELRNCLRKADVAGRLGGDEFAVVLFDCTAEDAARTARRIVSGIAAEPLKCAQATVPLTVSAGCLWLKPTGRECQLETLITAADKLMYEVKKAGGNDVLARSART